MLTLLDTGVLLRLLERSDPQNAAIRLAVKNLQIRGDTPVTSNQNVAEFWNVCTRPSSSRGGYGLSVSDTDRRLRIIERIVRVLPDTPASYSFWRHFVVSNDVKGVQVHDARLVAWMKAQGINQIVTLNGHDFARYPGITVVSPLDVTAESTEMP